MDVQTYQKAPRIQKRWPSKDVHYASGRVLHDFVLRDLIPEVFGRADWQIREAPVRLGGDQLRPNLRAKTVIPTDAAKPNDVLTTATLTPTTCLAITLAAPTVHGSTPARPISPGSPHTTQGLRNHGECKRPTATNSGEAATLGQAVVRLVPNLLRE